MGLYMGLMSGTSMDMVDAVLAEISDTGVRVVAQAATAIPAGLGKRLNRALDTGALPALEAWRLDAEVGALFARAAQAVLSEAGVKASRVLAIGSHGQTLYHAPDGTPPLTVQVGDPNLIAAATGITTVADFRRMDLAAGGQGAPLAPLFHRFAFSARQPRAILNLGGIANITVLPGAGGGGSLAGFDTGPGNTLLDLWAARHLGRPFDEDGRWAAGGETDGPLLERLLADDYFTRPPPKSTGREHFNQAWLDAALAGTGTPEPRDVQRTLLELTVASVARAVTLHAPETSELYVCGGGAGNLCLMDGLANALPAHRVASTAGLGVPPRAVEGAAFAWLARERLEGRSAGCGSVTGASRAATLGGIYRP